MLNRALNGKDKMKLVPLLVVPLVLGACAARESAQPPISLTTEAQERCARQCEYIHGGTVRGCRGGPTGATRQAGLIEECVNRAYAELRDCYRECRIDGL